MTEVELNKIEARANAATPGPWAIGEEHECMAQIEAVDLVIWEGQRNRRIFTILDSNILTPEHMGNREFIIHARDDVPKLLAKVRRLRKVCKRAIEMIGRAEDFGPVTEAAGILQDALLEP